MCVCWGGSAVTLILLLCVGVNLRRGGRCSDDGDDKAAGREVRTERTTWRDGEVEDGEVEDGEAAEETC